MSNIGAKAKARKAQEEATAARVAAGELCPDCWCPSRGTGPRQVRRRDAANYGDPCVNDFHSHRLNLSTLKATW